MDLEKVMQIKAACENVSKESCSIVIHTLNQDNTMKWIENMLPTVDGVIRKESAQILRRFLINTLLITQ